jgi:hypothetical protein
VAKRRDALAPALPHVIAAMLKKTDRTESGPWSEIFVARSYLLARQIRMVSNTTPRTFII